MDNEPDDIETMNSIRTKWREFDIPYDENRHIELITFGASHADIALLFFASIEGKEEEFTKIYLKSEDGQQLTQSLKNLDREQRVEHLREVKKDKREFLEEQTRLANLTLNLDLNKIDTNKVEKMRIKLLRIEELIDLENDINGKS